MFSSTVFNKFNVGSFKRSIDEVIMLVDSFVIQHQRKTVLEDCKQKQLR